MTTFYPNQTITSYAWAGLSLPEIPAPLMWQALHAGFARSDSYVHTPAAVADLWRSLPFKGVNGFGIALRPNVSADQYRPVYPPGALWRFIKGRGWCAFWRDICELRGRELWAGKISSGTPGIIAELRTACARAASQPEFEPGVVRFPWERSHRAVLVDVAIDRESTRLASFSLGDACVAIALARTQPADVAAIGSAVWLEEKS